MVFGWLKGVGARAAAGVLKGFVAASVGLSMAVVIDGAGTWLKLFAEPVEAPPKAPGCEGADGWPNGMLA